MAKKNRPVHMTGGAVAAQPTAAKINPTKANALRLADAYFVSAFIEFPVAVVAEKSFFRSVAQRRIRRKGCDLLTSHRNSTDDGTGVVR
jgi:hypothetical protein